MIACSDLGKIGEAHELQTIPYGSTETFVRGQNTYKILGNGQSVEYILFVEGNDVQAEKYASILAVAFSNIKFYYDEKYTPYGRKSGTKHAHDYAQKHNRTIYRFPLFQSVP